MTSEDKALAIPIPVGESGLMLRTTDDVRSIAQLIWRSKLTPKSYENEAQVGVAILAGARVGMSPDVAVRSIYIVNKIPTWLTKAARALIIDSGQLKPGTQIEEGVEHANDCEYEKEGKRCVDLCHGYCQTWHKDHAAPRRHTFYVHEAKTAGLWKKAGPWQEYPTRMLMHRACGFHADDCWGDVLLGMSIKEAVEDYPPAAFVREGESAATYTEPPGRDPLLPRANGAATVTTETVKKEEAGAASVSSEPTPDVGSSESGASSAPPAPASSEPKKRRRVSKPGAKVQQEGAGNDAQGEPAETVDETAAKVETHDAAEAPAPSDDQDDEPLPMYCEMNGCHHKIDTRTEFYFTYNDGNFRCSECGPRQ